jgi:peptide/nickel transport system substrate-binding protein
VNDRDQITAFDLGRTDIAEIAPENIRRARADGRSLVSSRPSELLALIFSAAPEADEDIHLRNALALSIDTSAINNVVFQGGGDPSRALLPEWLSGYAFVFSPQAASTPIEQARRERALAKQNAPLLLAYDPTDPVARTVAERIFLNARDIGVAVQLTTSGRSDCALRRVALASTDAKTALAELAKTLALPVPKTTGDSVTDVYDAEKGLLQDHRVYPLIPLRSAAALRVNVHDFVVSPDAGWQLSNVWLTPEKP